MPRKFQDSPKFVTFRVNSVVSLNRNEVFEGVPYLVVPTVGLVEGVLNGVFVSASEFGHFVEAWNGQPVVVQHPKKHGESVSANSPEILEEYRIGQLFNSTMDGLKFKTEMWINLNRVEELSDDVKGVVARLQNEKPVEVSTAYYSDITIESGIYNDEEFIGVAHTFKPDHLAVLVDEIGACSIEDGCGAPRVNSEEEKVGKREEKETQNFIKANQDVSFGDITNALRSALVEDVTGDWVWITEVYDDFLIYEVESEDGSNPIELFKRTYEIDEDMAVEFGDPVGVIKQISYVENSSGSNDSKEEGVMNRLKPLISSLANLVGMNINGGDKTITVNIDKCDVCGEKHESLDFKPVKGNAYLYANCPTLEQPLVRSAPEENVSLESVSESDKEGVASNTGSESESTSHEEVKVMEGKELVDSLIINDQTEFTEDDRDGLMKLTTCSLKSLVPVVNEETKETGSENKEETETHEEAISANADDTAAEQDIGPLTVEDYVGSIRNPEVAEFITQAVNRLTTQKETMVSEIVENSDFTAEDLEGKSTNDLEKIHALATVPAIADYSGRGGLRTHSRPVVNDGMGVPEAPSIVAPATNAGDEGGAS